MRVVVDTNIVLDVLVFEDPGVQPLREALQAGGRWCVTPAMRAELQRVLDYPMIARRRAQRGLSLDDVMAAFDAWAELHPVAAKAPYTCKDPDDQGFVDLACALGIDLISKDNAVLALHKRLLRLRVTVRRRWTPADGDSSPV
jgi:predicted nucleic acid-binding protein